MERLHEPIVSNVSAPCCRVVCASKTTLCCKRSQLETPVAGRHTSKLLRHLFGEVPNEEAVHKIVIVRFELSKGVL